ncbi:GDP-mannose mannosyl hydrolase [Halorhodospira sp. 9621]|uniref:GDP-mannose mannosyl hydrolase n=1 Tax=Halorhodospira sp. 9621 TaxID=2899135 RepID=UPI001EE98917|nr:GDP-mannose mannosyl hydrolase [Halorhodospira sp. 9621]
MWLPAETFQQVIAAAPLVSIDLLIHDGAGRYLLGERTNPPAQGWWFVPGGRVRKGESLDEAFRRVTQAELGQTLERADAEFLGVYEHFYSDSALDEQTPTHYVVLAYRSAMTDLPQAAPPDDQHRQVGWWPAERIRLATDVHPYTQAYFL